MKDDLTYYKSIRHEKNRANDLGKKNYEANMNIEIIRLETGHPEFLGKQCDCGKFTNCTG